LRKTKDWFFWGAKVRRVGQGVLENRLIGTVRRPGFWFTVVLLVLITIPHYGETLEHPAFLSQLTANLGLDRHAFERILFLAPIAWAGFVFGWKGGFITSLVALACMLPRVIFISPYPVDAIFEMSAVFIIGNVVAVTFDSLRKERKRRAYLAALNQTSDVISQSLELKEVLKSSISDVMGVIKVDAALAFLVDERAAKLDLVAYRGVSENFARNVDRLEIGEGLNGRVARTGEPMLVRDASTDPRLTRMVVREEGIKSMLIVPLRSKGKIMGTLCVVVHSYRQFKQDEVELLTAIGNQIGVAIENARLYEEAREVAERLRISEERYRQLFENAHDAIWIHDLDGKIIAANRSFLDLVGYSFGELRKIRASQLMAEGCAESLAEIGRRRLSGEPVGWLSEATLIKKDGSRASVQLSTNPVFSGGQPVAFQHVARDITQEKRMKENLQFYLRQVTMAQEEERKRISRELHDETIQELVVLSRELDSLTSGGNLSEEDRERLEKLYEEINGIIGGVRRLSQDLRPAALDSLGLLPALEWLASDVSAYSKIESKVSVLGTPRRLPQETELVLFRITQEALRNVWRHSQAAHVEVTVEFSQDNIRLVVRDDGIGFSPPEATNDLVRGGRLGLAGMQERIQLIGGNLRIESEQGKGTTVMIEAPI